MENNTEDAWKKCSTCKKPIHYSQKYYVCSVSTCNGQRTGYSFCSIPCFESHLPGARHRDAGAIEKKAPEDSLHSQEEASSQPQRPPEKRRIQSAASMPGAVTSSSSSSINVVPHDILIVASKLKDYIRARSEMNTSASVMDILSDIVRIECDRAIENARREGRKTVLDRDFKKI
jgi:hypothetical protein